MSPRDFRYFQRVAVWSLDCKVLCMENALPSHLDGHKFKTTLEARIAELERSLGYRDFIAVEQIADQLDVIQQASERTLVISNLDRCWQQLRDARAALRRLAQRSFGVCQECGDDISPRRLLAIPWAALCVHCQEELDRSCQWAPETANNVISSFGL
jgi:DnaK suppressor protein